DCHLCGSPFREMQQVVDGGDSSQGASYCTQFGSAPANVSHVFVSGAELVRAAVSSVVPKQQSVAALLLSHCPWIVKQDLFMEARSLIKVTLWWWVKVFFLKTDNTVQTFYGCC
ncbi:MAG: hypothetical protein ACKPKO_16650, partial [Candidatus Fonsibacter sp.]